MGHVDHGKTKTLDAIRKTNVVAGEFWRNHAAHWRVSSREKRISADIYRHSCHEAFTVMRSRGAKVADIAVLVVAADDGVQPQTKEAA